mmetsp:Transcript_9896/g.32705  ORF Transcript_9896/g.32705 Transcript_9896/m.32705 type:complete len:203 (+) Transcript_9896:1939-2547(+)
MHRRDRGFRVRLAVSAHHELRDGEGGGRGRSANRPGAADAAAGASGTRTKLLLLVITRVQNAAREQSVHRDDAASPHRGHHSSRGPRSASSAPFAAGHGGGRSRDVWPVLNRVAPSPGPAGTEIAPRVLRVAAFWRERERARPCAASFLPRRHRRGRTHPLRQNAARLPPFHLFLNILRVTHRPRLALQRHQAIRGESRGFR